MLVDCCMAARGKEMEKKGMKGVRLGYCGEEKRGKRERRYNAAVAAAGCGVGGAPVVSGFSGEEKIQRGRGESEADLFCARVIRFFGYWG
ncbi:hypothetical protein HAX54_046560, partial [Datura stramonium]|nr:hypothetical protein [Datura stramonium]